MLRLAALALILSACSDPYGEAQKVDTITGWEAYIQDNPRSPKKAMAEIRLEELYLTAAREAKSLESYDTYLTKFPKGKMVDDAKKERREFLIEWARTTDTIESWEKYLAEYPAGYSARYFSQDSMVSVVRAHSIRNSRRSFLASSTILPFGNLVR